MPEGRPPPRNHSLGHLNAKFVASRHEIPVFCPKPVFSMKHSAF